ncbi:L-fucokinase [uncultured Paludibaculum sp.]|uniref:fucose pyrophosphorylase domain-containing protein n=1 Tax=uncultured Paludibaculum sp. TaxID=1765020 RepID=UPI002AABB9F3|nr:L-fucokinase [uncultured Paludibaculum sp.]
MTRMPEAWDYLILTASNERQASAYESQLELRRQTGHLARVRQTLVVADLEGRRIGSGGSTLQCLLEVLNREARNLPPGALAGGGAERILRSLRILIVHAGGDSRRLPAYGPCGKIFVPVPGESESAHGRTLFDRLTPAFLDMPPGLPGEGQLLVTSGDALILFDASGVEFAKPGLTALGCYCPVEEAALHGVFQTGDDDQIKLYLQKPSVAEQRAMGLLNESNQAILDVGVMNFDAAASAALLRAFPVELDSAGQLVWTNEVRSAMLERGVDLYREICCAMGTETTLDHYLRSARSSGSAWSDEQLTSLYPALRAVPFHIQLLPGCVFLHFGSTREIISSGITLGTEDRVVPPGVTCLALNSHTADNGSISGAEAWVESCDVRAPFVLEGRNVAAGLDVTAPLTLLRGACIDVLRGIDRQGGKVWFIRCYGVDDEFKKPAGKGGLFCGRPMLRWLEAAGLTPEDVWDASVPESDRSLWNARVFPAEAEQDYQRWLWIFDVDRASDEQLSAFAAADRYSAEEVALLADQDAFHGRRAQIRATQVRSSLSHLFRPKSAFSAADLAVTFQQSADRAALAHEVLALAFARKLGTGKPRLEHLAPGRILHTLGSAVERLAAPGACVDTVLPGLRGLLRTDVAAWMASTGISLDDGCAVGDWCARLRACAFRQMHEIILTSSLRAGGRPRNALRPDETIWGRGPARIELGGGWTDTPPYTLECGGDVANVAVNLNGQPPIHCYCRLVDEPVIRLNSIDGGRRLEITELSELVDYRRPGDRFALSKAALAISGFSHEAADWPAGFTLRQMLAEFGGGIEMTTLVGIPKGSGLGTSSILGAVILAVVNRLMGRPLDQRMLFHDVLRLEQALTTGGGWQDQAGGGVGGAKITSTTPGLIPAARIHYVPSDIIDPKANGGSTLLYYTGMTRIAKNILEQIVGGYLDRDRATLQALAEEHLVARQIADVLSRKDAKAFGALVNAAWELQKRLCGTVTNGPIEDLLNKVRPYVHGMRISGAGSGGFLLMICKSPAHAAQVREILEREPLNDRSRFFDFEINHAGLEVTTC